MSSGPQALLVPNSLVNSRRLDHYRYDPSQQHELLRLFPPSEALTNLEDDRTRFRACHPSKERFGPPKV
jgi:hypothetical protein